MRRDDARSVFVTVGTTSFDDLVRAACSPQMYEVFKSKGYNKITIQYGRGSYIPQAVNDSTDGGFIAEHFTFKPSLSDYMHSSDLIISHAGSGSVFESLHAQKPLIVVVNEALMDNHQSELAEALEEQSYLVCATPTTLEHVVSNFESSALQTYPPPDPMAVATALDAMLGFPS